MSSLSGGDMMDSNGTGMAENPLDAGESNLPTNVTTNSRQLPPSQLLERQEDIMVDDAQTPNWVCVCVTTRPDGPFPDFQAQSQYGSSSRMKEHWEEIEDAGVHLWRRAMLFEDMATGIHYDTVEYVRDLAKFLAETYDKIHPNADENHWIWSRTQFSDGSVKVHRAVWVGNHPKSLNYRWVFLEGLTKLPYVPFGNILSGKVKMGDIL